MSSLDGLNRLNFGRASAVSACRRRSRQIPPRRPPPAARVRVRPCCRVVSVRSDPLVRPGAKRASVWRERGERGAWLFAEG